MLHVQLVADATPDRSWRGHDAVPIRAPARPAMLPLLPMSLASPIAESSPAPHKISTYILFGVGLLALLGLGIAAARRLGK